MGTTADAIPPSPAAPTQLSIPFFVTNGGGRRHRMEEGRGGASQQKKRRGQGLKMVGPGLGLSFPRQCHPCPNNGWMECQGEGGGGKG